MNIKSKIIISCLILCLFVSISAVSATDTNDTQYMSENNDLLAINFLDENLTVDESADEMLGADGGSFSDLESDIAGASGTFSLNRNYSATSNYPIEISQDNIIIDGNNYVIDAAALSSVFKITGNNVVLKNIKILNAVSDKSGSAIIWEGNDGTIDNCIFKNNTAHTTPGMMTSAGGAIIWSGNNANIKNSRFEENSITGIGSNGGALALISCENIVENCV